jgi:hypothetical protein
LSLGSAVCEKLAAEACAHRLTKEVDQVSRHLAATYEEISLLYTITRNLRISRTDEELGKLAVEWMAECVPAESFAVQYLPTCDDGSGSCRSRTRSGPLMITQGGCPVDSEQFGRLLTTLNLDAGSGPYIANRRTTDSADWGFPAVRQLILAPLAEGNNVFGWIAAFNHREAVDFGSVEANLLSSIGSLLGIHSGNRDLYRQQSSLVASVVRALVSAIDAKDPYTSGHSDRVARFAVRIALEMQCHPKLLNTIYMAGLLHDVGKIGIGDQVLRKPGRLTEAEYEHIKLHPGLGHRILADLKQLGDVLPAVLHHHEQWNGLGYPVGLAADEIPRIARIIAVADAYDAMSSDRPYRSGMPPEKVDEIFREGAGKFWDPDVVQAYFAARPDFAEIMRTEASPVDVVPKEWT